MFNAGRNSDINNTGKASDHLANERTFLAWMRTSIGIMAFGFVVVKFSLFLRQLSLVLGKNVTVPQHGYSTFIGIFLVAAGALTTLLSYSRYKATKKQIEENNFQSSSTLMIATTLVIFLASILLVAYLVQSTR